MLLKRDMSVERWYMVRGSLKTRNKKKTQARQVFFFARHKKNKDPRYAEPNFIKIRLYMLGPRLGILGQMIVVIQILSRYSKERLNEMPLTKIVRLTPCNVQSISTYFNINGNFHTHLI